MKKMLVLFLALVGIFALTEFWITGAWARTATLW